MKKIPLLLLMAALMIFSSACSGGSNEIAGTGTGSGTSAVTGGTEEEKEPVHPTRFWLQWSGSSIPRPGTKSSVCAWNWLTAAKAGVNVMSVHYLAHYDDGKTVKGIADPARLAKEMELMKYELKESAKAGVKVYGYIDTCQFDDAVAAELGYTIEQLGAKDKAGNYIYCTAWNDGCYIACINSPQWREWLTEDLKLTAEAGFAGLQYDFHPYAAAGYFCQCENCKKSWAEYSKKELGEEKALLFGKIDFSSKEGRAYWAWKNQCFTDFMRETVSEAKKVNPDFMLNMNQNANGYAYSLEGLTGAWDVPSSEFHSSNNGYSSTLYMYQLTEALGYDDCLSIYNDSSMMNPEWRAKVNLAESYGTIGGMSYPNDRGGFSKNMYTFMAANEDLYRDTVSCARAAVLYSAWGNICSVPRGELDLGGQLYNFGNDQARRAASALLLSGVSYDYYCVEKGDTNKKLSDYDLLVIPNYTYFDTEVWKPLLQQASKNGTRIVVVGDNTAALVKGIYSDDRFTFVPGFNPCTDESQLLVNDAFTAAVKDTAAAGLLTPVNNKKTVALTVRSADGKQVVISAIRRNGEDNAENPFQTMTYTVPEGKKIAAMQAYCPFSETAQIRVDYTVENGVARITTGDFDTYAVIRVTLE